MWKPILIGTARFFAGAFLCNALPHLLSGLMGMRFPSPFASPPGLGESSAIVNSLWGMANLTVGALLLKPGAFKFGVNWQTLLVWLGALVMAIGLSSHFESVRYGKPGLRTDIQASTLKTALA